MTPALLAAKLIAILESVARLEGGILTRIAIRAIKRLIVYQILSISGWATGLLTREDMPESVEQLREWLHKEIRSELPRLFRLVCSPAKAVDAICDSILEHPKTLTRVAAAVTAPIELPTLKRPESE